MTQPMKICFLAGTLGQGGAERQLYYMLSALRQAGHEIHLLCLTQGEFWEGPIGNLGVSVHHVGEQEGKLQRLRLITSKLRELKPDLIQSQHFYVNLYAALAGRVLGIPAIGAIRNNLSSEIKANGAILGKLSFLLPKHLIANSLEAVELAKKLGKKDNRIFYLPNAVDTVRFSPRPRQPERAIVNFLAMGRLTPQKRFDRLLEIMALVGQKLPPKSFALSLIGSGPLEAALSKRISELREQGLQISLLPPTPKPEDFYQDVDVFVLSSDHEGTPNVVLEAMASALPVVCTRVGNLGQMISPGINGFLFEREDTVSIAEGLTSLAVDPVLRQTVGNEARTYALENHSCDFIGKSLINIYKTIISR